MKVTPKMWYWITGIGLVLALSITCYILGRNHSSASYVELIKQKDAEITRLSTLAQGKENEANISMGEYKVLAEKARAYDKIIAKYKAMIANEKAKPPVVAPKNVQETLDRAKKLGIDAKVECK
jgi:hypothetical protein